jgi:hypothetical protein
MSPEQHQKAFRREKRMTSTAESRLIKDEKREE